MKCSQIKCIVNRLVGHREVRLGRMFLKRPDGVVCEQFKRRELGRFLRYHRVGLSRSAATNLTLYNIARSVQVVDALIK